MENKLCLRAGGNESWVINGDEKEVQGLIDKGTLKFIETPPT